MPEEESSLIDGLNPFKRPKAPAATTRAKPERKKREPVGRKKNLSDGLTMVWGMAGGAVHLRGMAQGRPTAVGRVMQIQAPVAGRELNKLIADHDILYRIVSPFLGAAEIGVMTRVVGPPLLVWAVERRPELLPMLEPMLMPMLLDLYTELQKMKAKQREMMAALAEEGESADEGFREWLVAMGLAETESPGGAPSPPPRIEHEPPPESFEPEPEPVMGGDVLINPVTQRPVQVRDPFFET